MELDLSSHGIVALVRNKDGKFLLLEDGRPQMRGHWAPPHGRCEPDDSSEEAGVVRETFEETGLQVIPIKKLLTQPADTKVKTVSFWLVDTLSSDADLKIDESETSDHAWSTIEEAMKQQLYPGTKIFFNKIIDGEISLD